MSITCLVSNGQPLNSPASSCTSKWMDLLHYALRHICVWTCLPHGTSNAVKNSYLIQFLRCANDVMRYNFLEQVEQWYGTEYSFDPIPEEVIQSWEQCGRRKELRLPEPNPVIATVRRRRRTKFGVSFQAILSAAVFLFSQNCVSYLGLGRYQYPELLSIANTLVTQASILSCALKVPE